MTKRVPVKSLALSATLLVSLAGYEGYRSNAYEDIVGVPTIGFGTTEGVEIGDRIDPIRALVRLQDDADKHARGFSQCLGDVPLAQHEYDAYISWTYNVGISAACGSTLMKKLKAHDYEGACKELLRWKYAGGKVVPGLIKRRLKEYSTCIGKE